VQKREKKKRGRAAPRGKRKFASIRPNRTQIGRRRGRGEKKDETPPKKKVFSYHEPEAFATAEKKKKTRPLVPSEEGEKKGRKIPPHGGEKKELSGISPKEKEGKERTARPETSKKKSKGGERGEGLYRKGKNPRADKKHQQVRELSCIRKGKKKKRPKKRQPQTPQPNIAAKKKDSSIA